MTGARADHGHDSEEGAREYVTEQDLAFAHTLGARRPHMVTREFLDHAAARESNKHCDLL